MIFKKFKNFNHPKTFKFPDPDTKRLFTGTSVKDLATQVSGYRKQNELEELEYLEATITNYLCHLPEHKGLCEPYRQPNRTIFQYMRGGIAVLKNIAYKRFASQEVADERSEICANCPLNEFPNKGHFITWIDEIAVLSIGERKSKRHNDLGVCGGCSCPMRAKVFYADRIKLTKDQAETMSKVPNCWQLLNAEIVSK